MDANVTLLQFLGKPMLLSACMIIGQGTAYLNICPSMYSVSTHVPVHVPQQQCKKGGGYFAILTFCFSSNTLYTSSRLCWVMSTLSADVMHPLQARQSFRVILAFSSFFVPPPYERISLHTAAQCTCVNPQLTSLS